MKKLYMRQKLLRLNEQFTIIDEQERPVYFVEGSFMKIPKQFTIYNANQREIGKITKQLFVQKDVRGFEKDYFYIFKPNEKRLWHKAIGYLDVNEFADVILKAGRDTI